MTSRQSKDAPRCRGPGVQLCHPPSPKEQTAEAPVVLKLKVSGLGQLGHAS